MRAYIKLKLLTGLSRGDLPRLQPGVHFRDDGILVQRHKTANTSGKRTLYEWTPELRAAVDEALKARPLDIAPFLFCTRNGQGYLNEGDMLALRAKTERGWALVRAPVSRDFCFSDTKKNGQRMGFPVAAFHGRKYEQISADRDQGHRTFHGARSSRQMRFRRRQPGSGEGAPYPCGSAHHRACLPQKTGTGETWEGDRVGCADALCSTLSRRDSSPENGDDGRG
uniref:Phage integrase family protein n=1 Tax=Candidatus Kentrum sp. FM TaxID=2126340 RepID=A0A450SEV8_9GAMM|nr:MAG: hypothetical protein BECKFM1743A_GA0114220_100912 [Candidatus Kentron sp. FM]VFJ51238.1 MAG: hypothetical protein BECKFM1743C_GA0114222_100952 [Candidatus Kentron sp. FM]VFK08866.1 MAG: hypothetical protein BECKFM1743B_GA0114221_100842 [Candidatus Kentron sp. FM]